MKNTIRKLSRSGNFTQIHNSLFTDTRISADSRCALMYLLSKPDEWIIREMDIRKQFAPPGKDSASNHFYRKITKELQAVGYMKKVAIRDASNGQITAWETHISDEAVFLEDAEDAQMLNSQQLEENPDVEFTTCGEFTPLSNKDSFSNTEISLSDAETLANLWLINTNNPQAETINSISKRKHYVEPAQRLLAHFEYDLRLCHDLLTDKFQEMTNDGLTVYKMTTPVEQLINSRKRKIETKKPAYLGLIIEPDENGLV